MSGVGVRYWHAVRTRTSWKGVVVWESLDQGFSTRFETMFSMQSLLSKCRLHFQNIQVKSVDLFPFSVSLILWLHCRLIESRSLMISATSFVKFVNHLIEI